MNEMEDNPKSGAEPKRRDLANILIWTLIGVMFVLTAVWMVWASRQPKVHGFFSPDE